MKFTKKKIIISASIIIVVLIVVGIALSGKKGPEYTTFETKRGNLQQIVEATGKVESIDRIDLNFKASGRIIAFYVKEGEQVNAGQKLASLNAQALQAQVSDAQSRVLQEQANYNGKVS